MTSRLASRGLIVGYDTRFASEDFAEVVAEVMAGNGIKVYLCDQPAPTPVISYSVKSNHAGGAVIITASHNPGKWNGFKIKTENGSSVPQEVTSQIEHNILNYASHECIKRQNIKQAVDKNMVEYIDYAPLYKKQLSSLVDINTIRNSNLKIVIDPMYGAGAGYLVDILKGGNLKVIEIDGERNPVFPGMRQPEPIAHNLNNLSKMIKDTRSVVGLATDGDADRFGAVDENGVFLTTLQVYALLAFYLLEIRGEHGTIVRTITSTTMLDRLGELYGVPVRETPVGFKWVAAIMDKENALIGGEESGGYGFRGHVIERDGILASLYFLDLLVKTKKTPSQLIQQLYNKVGPHQFDRVDIKFNALERSMIVEKVKNYTPKDIGRVEVLRRDTFDGFRYVMKDTSWLLIRFSGTEPLLRIYSEAASMDRVHKLIEIGRKAAGV
jgi:phosphomannomutase